MQRADLEAARSDLAWTRARRYFPRPLSTYEQSSVGLMVAGMNHAARLYGLPVRYYGRVDRGLAFVAAQSASPTARGRDGLASAHHALSVRNLSISYAWRERWLPEILEHLEALSEENLVAIDDLQLGRCFADARKRARRLWQIHFEIVFPSQVGGPSWQRSEIPGRGGDASSSFWGAESERRIVAEAGRRLHASGAIAEPAHVQWLTAGEIQAALGGAADPALALESHRRMAASAHRTEETAESLRPASAQRTDVPAWLSAYT